MFKIRDLIKWERLTGRPFPSFDPTCRDDFDALLYATSGMDAGYTLDEFRAVVGRNPRLMGEESRRVERARRMMEQYAAATSTFQNPDSPIQSPNPQSRAVTVAETAYALIAAGMDAAYLLEQLPVWEMPPLAEAFAARDEAGWSRFKSACEVWRLVAYFSVVPHVMRGAVKDARSLFRFPWEQQRTRRDALADIERHAAEFREFMASGKRKF